MGLFDDMDNSAWMARKDYADTQRGSFMDYVHSAWKGTGSALDLTGAGLETLGMDTIGGGLRKASDYIESTELAKDDIDTTLGRDGRIKRVIGGVIESTPAALAPIVTGFATGAVAGPVAGVAAGSAVMATTYGAGTYGLSYEENIAAGLSEEDAKDKAFLDALLEVSTEAAGQAAGLLTFNTGVRIGVKGATRKILTAMMKGGFTNPEKLAVDVAKVVGKKTMIAKMVGAPMIGGASEVVNEIGQQKVAESYGVQRGKANLMDTFLIGTVMEGAFGSVGTALSKRENVAKIQAKLQKGLSGPDADLTSNAIYKSVAKVDPHLAGVWKEYYRLGGRDLDVSFEDLSNEKLPPKEAMEREVELYQPEVPTSKIVSTVTDPDKAAELVEKTLSPERNVEKEIYHEIAKRELIRQGMKPSDPISGPMSPLQETMAEQGNYEKNIEIPGGSSSPAQLSAAVFRDGERTVPMVFAESELTTVEKEAIKTELQGAKSNGFKGIVADLMTKHTNAGINNIMDMLVDEYQNTTNLKHKKQLGDEINGFFTKAEEQFGSKKGNKTITPKNAASTIEDIQDRAATMVNKVPTEVTKKIQTATELDPPTTATTVYTPDVTKDAEIQLRKEEEFAKLEQEIAKSTPVASGAGTSVPNIIQAKENTNSSSVDTVSPVEEALIAKEEGVVQEDVFGTPEEVEVPTGHSAIKWEKMDRSGATRHQEGVDADGTQWSLDNTGDGVVHVFKDDVLVESFEKPIRKPGIKKKYRQIDQARDYVKANGKNFEKPKAERKKPKPTTKTTTVIRRTKKEEIRTDTVETLKGKKEFVKIPDALDSFDDSVRGEVENGDVVEVDPVDFLTKLRDKAAASGQSEYKFIMDLVLKIAPKILEQLKIRFDNSIKNVGEYHPVNHVITLRADASVTTVLHEMVHAIVARKIYLDPKYKAKVYKLFNEFMRKRTNTKKVYGITNVQEFLAELVANGKFRDELRAIPSTQNPKVSLFDKAITLIKNAFTTKTHERSMLQDAFDVIFQDTEMIEKKPTDNKVIAMEQENQRAYRVRSLNDASAAFDQLNELKKYDEPIVVSGPKEFFKSTGKMIKHLGMGLTERLRYIEPKLIGYLRRMELAISEANIDASKSIKPFANFYHELPKDDRRLLDWALKNNDKEAMGIRKDIMGDKFTEVFDLLDDIHTRMGKVGLNSFAELEHYYPRRVKDSEGLMKYLRASRDIKELEKTLKRKLSEDEKKDLKKNRESLSILEEALLKAKDDKGSELTHNEKNEITNSILNTGRYQVISFNIPGAAKSRDINRVNPEMNQYYEDSLDALINHIYEANESIETRKAFNFTDRKKKVLLGNKLAREYKRTGSASTYKKLEGVSRELAELDSNVDEGITQFLSEEGLKFSTEQQREVVDIFRARLNQKGTSGAMSSIRNGMLITTLGNPTSAVTQLGDIAWSLYENGVKNTLGSIFGEKRMKRDDFDLERSMKEFNNGSSKYVDAVLKWSGLQHMDLFGKEAYMEASLRKAEGMTREQFIEYQAHIFKDPGKVWDTIKKDKYKVDGKWDKDVKFYVFNSLSNQQPISLSEMPAGYLLAANGRIFYTLKTYQIKAMNNIFREAKKPGGKKNAMRLIALLVLAGTTADELKDLLMGRSGTLRDTVHENVLKLAFLSKFSLKSKQTAKAILTDLIVPPIRMIDSPAHDMMNLVTGKGTYESLKLLPWGGLAFSKTTAGKQKNLDNERRDILDDLSRNLKKGNSLKGVRKRVKSYNKRAEKRIDFMAARRSAKRRIRRDSR